MSAVRQPVEAMGAEAARNDNLARLEGCIRPHVFLHEAPLTRAAGGSLWRCSRCGGAVSGREKHWYQAGLNDGRRAAAGR